MVNHIFIVFRKIHIEEKPHLKLVEDQSYLVFMVQWPKTSSFWRVSTQIGLDDNPVAKSRFFSVNFSI